MNIIETKLNGCFVIEPQIFNDERGYFFESFNQQKFFKKTGLEISFVQDNQSKSDYGVLRGLHFQKGKFSQAKLVRVIEGKILDVVVDLRKESPSYGNHFSLELSAENQKQLFIPRGFAHGFVVLSKTATFLYKCDNFYHKDAESGIIYNDPTLNIDWKIPTSDIIISNKDQNLPKLEIVRP